ncbi:MAG: guanylate kinase [Candidatus Magasanikbacteria bacterium CG10_big_fil_rev_8_21_14_0_10_36_32]|uniref:Guanylate kinase n=1 Tax=Candidatus Magasanikbacteria bacterium CG10_big_fil_rev_8_21_14_0_10_36_32 TaxID=1974646 RepID=A0A2M6W6H5_9BACT|nr:MAG: guanylate kinase [Candidatus Magasanikbacteria bacterium CG10_big_fil_rev_8_21_14_0_10_36_32]
MPEEQHRGLLVVVSAPSGGGKDSVIDALLKIFPNSTRLITTTTRPKRPGEIDGINYYFISPDTFQNLIMNKELIEYNFYANQYYGMQKSKLKEALEKYDLVFSNIEVNGKKNMDGAGIKNLSIFLLPESMEVLHRRIVVRGGLTPDVIEERLETASKEIAQSNSYDYQVVNKEGKLEETIAQVADVLKKHLAEHQENLS